MCVMAEYGGEIVPAFPYKYVCQWQLKLIYFLKLTS